jgi:hypothetical protein
MAANRRNRSASERHTMGHGAGPQPSRWEHGLGGVSGTAIGTTVLVGAAVALLEPELLIGMGIGVAATALPRVLPLLGDALRPVFRSAVRAGYATVSRTREVTAEAGEEIQDVLADVRSEYEEAVAEAKSESGTQAEGFSEREHTERRAPQSERRTRRTASRRRRAS